MTGGRGMLVQQLFEKVVELVGAGLWRSEESGPKIGFKGGGVDRREFPGLEVHRRAREAGETELRHDAVAVWLVPVCSRHQWTEGRCRGWSETG